MAKYLYPNFLENKKAYNLAQGSWNRLLKSILREYDYTSFPYINQMQNGKKEYDGNPIFSAYIPEIQRAIRIIQVAPDEEGGDISAWIDDIELRGKIDVGKIEELVLDLKFSQKSKAFAKEAIHKWITQELDSETLDELLEAKVQ